MRNRRDTILKRRREEYARNLPDKLRQLYKALYMARSPNSAFTAWLEAARIQAHRLAGSAGTFGFPGVGDAAKKVETAVLELQKVCGGSPELWQFVEEAMLEATEAAAHSEDDDPFGDPITTEQPFLKQATLLVVDDDPDFIDYLLDLTRCDPIRVLKAHSVEEAIQVAREHVLDAAILDVHLGEFSTSFSLASELRSLSPGGKIAVAFASADNGLLQRLSAAQAGAALYLSKPVAPAAVRDALRQLLASTQTSESPRILLIDDDADFVASLGLVLSEEGMQIHTCTDSRAALEVVAEVRPDLMIIDYLMPEVNGIDVCRMVRTNPTWQSLPIIMLSATTEREQSLAAFKSGADDFVPKPVRADDLLARIRARLERSKLLRDHADKDALTGLLSRRAMSDRITARLAEAKRQKTKLTVCLLDIDHFKGINDQYGHSTGDRVLATFGRVLSELLRTEDLRCRWGGEEFLLALYDDRSENAAEVLSRVRVRLKSTPFDDGKRGQFRATFSAGVAVYPSDASSLEELLELADRRLYAAKRAGRDCTISSD